MKSKSEAKPNHRSTTGPNRLRFFRVVATCFSLLFCLVAAEIVTRLVRGKPWYERLVEEQSVTMEIFHIGGFQFPLRAGPDTTAKAPGVYRIFFLGDSFTYGQGLKDQSKAFVPQIVSRLNKRQPLSQPHQFEAFNGGMPGSRTPHWVQLSSVMLRHYDPDLVVAVFFLRDGLAGVTSIGQIDQVRDGMLALSRDSLLFRYSSLFRLYKERRAQRDLAHTHLSAMRDGYLGDVSQTLQWQRAQSDLIALKRSAADIGAGFALVVFPVLFELDGAHPLADVCEEIERFCHTEGIPVHSLLQSFLGHDADTLWVSAFDQHPNARGHEIASKGMYPFLETIIRSGNVGPGSDGKD